jgi:hypothetical protein
MLLQWRQFAGKKRQALDITGRSFFLSMDAENRIDVSMIPAGIYQLIASSDKHNYKCKLLIAR